VSIASAPDPAPEPPPRPELAEVDVSVILPVFNESGHIQQEVERVRQGLDRSRYSYEIIAVDDGSTDDSRAVLESIEGIRLITFGRNRGSGSARKAGTRAARGRVVVWTDADMTYPNEHIPALVSQMEGFDQVVGARTSEKGTRKALRVPAKWFIRKLAEYLTNTAIPDLNSGFRAFRRDVAAQYLHLLPPGFSCVTTITMAFLSNGYSVHYVPITYEKRAGLSKFHWWADTRRYGLQVIRLMLSYNPLRVFLPGGLLLFVVASGKLLFDWVGRDFHLAANTLLIFFAAFQLLVIGLLADLIVRIARAPDEIDPAADERS
jgi:glycosyltransferase involved in cell wall biosynthesis